MKKKILLLFLIFSLSLSLFPQSVYALDYNCPVETVSESIYLVNLDTGISVYEKAADEPRFPASTAKILTYIVAYENIENVENTRILIKQEILDTLLGTGSSLSGLERHVGDKMTAKDLLYCLMVSSGNDAAVVLADYVGKGNIDKFVDMMNAKAKEIGCTNTHFSNPHGLDDDLTLEQQHTTAKDLYIMAKYALTLPYFSEITNTTAYYCEGDEDYWPLITTNYMIDSVRGGEYYYTYARGIKTGTTDKAGRCLVSTAIADGYAYLCVILKAPYVENGKYHNMLDSAELYRWALLNLHLQPAVTKQTPICKQKINYAWGIDSILLYPEKEVSTLMLKDEDDENVGVDGQEVEEDFITIETDIQDSVDAPIKKGDVLGTATIKYRGMTLEKINIVSSEDVDQSAVLFAMHIINNVVVSLWFWLALVVAAILFVIYLILHNRFGGKKKNSKHVKRYRNF